MTVKKGSEPPNAGPTSRRPGRLERYARHPPGARFWVGLAMLAFYTGVGVSAIFVFGRALGTLPFNYGWANGNVVLGPSAAHPLGVIAGFGTGLFGAIWRATPWDLAIVAGILGIDTALGWTVGAVAGLHPDGLADRVLMLVCETIGAIPSIVLVCLAYFGSLWFAYPAPSQVYPAAWGYDGLVVFVVVFGLVLWPRMARAVRDRAQFVANSMYVEASRASGASSRRILFRQIMPNSLGPVLAQVPVDLAPIFFVLTIGPWLATCGEGPPPPGIYYVVPALPPISPLPSTYFPEWGFLLGVGACEGIGAGSGVLYDYWWMYLFPLLAILGLGLAIGLLCDGLDRWRQLKE